MKNKNLIIILLTIIFCVNVKAQKPILFIGGTAHLGNGKVIKNSIISVSGEKYLKNLAISGEHRAKNGVCVCIEGCVAECGIGLKIQKNQGNS